VRYRAPRRSSGFFPGAEFPPEEGPRGRVFGGVPEQKPRRAEEESVPEDKPRRAGEEDAPKERPRKREPQLRGEEFLVKGKIVQPQYHSRLGLLIPGDHAGKPAGDDWKEKMRKQWAKAFPGIKP